MVETTTTTAGRFPQYALFQFTKDCEQAMFNESLSKLSDRLRTMQREAVLAMRGELSEEDNLIGKRTIVDLSEYLNTVDKLQAAGANAKRVWGGEMRQYEGRLFKCGDFEQQGSEEVTAKEKLITTEQTCMVRRSYFKACCEGKILLVIGQCGTGKTETCKDISNVLGKTCEVLSTNGLATIDASMRKLIEEVGAKQGVLIMDEFNRMPTHAQVSWFNACKEAKVFLIGTYDPFTADANEIHKDVMASAVKQYLTVPDFGKLVEHMLHFQGLQEGKKLGAMFLKFMSMMEKLFSRAKGHSHMDLGLRTIIAITRMVGTQFREPQEADELTILAQVCLNVFYARSSEEMRPYLMNIITESFSYVDITVEESFQQPEWDGCSSMIASIFKVRHGALVLKVTDSNEADVRTAIQKRADALNAEIVDLGAVMANTADDDLFGEKGLFAAAIQKANATAKSQAWIVASVGDYKKFGRDPAVSFDYLNTVLDDNKTLCCKSGERVKLANTTRVLFLAPDVEGLSPAHTSRMECVMRA